MSGGTERWWRRRLTGLLEPLRRRFERNRARHRGLRRHLNQAQMAITYDDYLSRIAVTAVGGGLALFVLVFVVLQSLTILSGVDILTVSINAGIALGAGLVTGLAAWYVGYTRPRRIANRRARRLNVTLPSTVSYMYALAHGGLDAVAIVRRTADREDSYGEVAREMRMVTNEMEFVGSDFITALQNAAELTPCRATSDFLSDMVGVLESGGDFEAFLDERRAEFVDDISSEQESYLEQIGLFAELYVTALVAGPLFLIILLLVIGILGSETAAPVAIVVYVGLPLGTLFALLGLDLLDAPVAGVDVTPPDDPGPTVPDDEDARTYATRKRRLETLTRLKNPLERFVYSPTATLAVTVPLAVLSVGAVVLSGAVDPTVEAFRARRFTATGLLVVLPFLLVTVPIAVFYEIRRRYADRIRKRFPDALSSIARANRSGIGTVEAIKMEAERSGGRVGDELERLHNDIRWFHDPSDAFLRLANRARMQMTVRTMRLLAEANRASGDLHRTLSVAADEARFHKQFAESRAREVATYVAVAIISFLVFLGIILMLQQFYLERIVETGAQTTVAPGGLGVPGSLQSIDAGAFRLIFLHAVLVQGACIGLVTGKLSRGTALAGIKYSIGMVVVSFVLFGVI